MTKDNSLIATSVYESSVRENLFIPGDKVLVCVSGGADSVALLHILMELKSKLNIDIGIAHLNHQLRGDESDRDCDVVKHIAEKHDLRFHYTASSVKTFQEENRLSLEDAARQVRYRFFYETARSHGYTRIATAHSANDNAELVLMNLLRGSGLTGISGIPAKRDIIVRPLLWTKREEIMAYITSKKLTYVTDSSNMDNTFLRNRIRNELIPLIKNDFNGNIIDTLNRTSNILSEEDSWLNALIKPHIEQATVRRTEDTFSFSVTLFNPLDKAIKRRLIRHAIQSLKGDLKKITLFHIDLALEMADSVKKALSSDLPDKIRIHKQNDVLTIKKYKHNLRFKETSEEKSYSITLNNIDTEKTISIPNISSRLTFTILDKPKKITYHNNIAWLDLDRVSFPMQIRSPNSDDRFRPLGMSGKQTLKKFFQSNNISSENRYKHPLVISNSDIIWVGGHRIHNDFRIQARTKKVLKIELFLD